MNSNKDAGESNVSRERKSSAGSAPARKKSSGKGRPRVEARVSVEELRAAFKKQMSCPGSQEANIDMQIFDPMEKCRDFLGKARKQTGIVYDDEMARHYCLWDDNYPELPQRYTAVINRCNELGLLQRCHRVPSREVTKEELVALHSEEHIELMRKTSEITDERELEEISSRYDAIYLHPESYKGAQLAAGSVIDLMKSVLKREVHNGMAIVRPPGHHAMKSAACGYCLFNTVALAAKYALEHQGVRKILIVDWDVHHGQGTQQMFYDDDRVLYFSVHRYEDGEFWPHLRESNYDCIGENKGRGYTCNVPLNTTGLGDKEYIAIWTQLLLPLAYQFGPEVVLVSGGYDAAVGDIKGLMQVTPACYSQLTSLLMQLAEGKLVVVLEGGYCLESLSEGAALTLKTLLGDPCPPLIDCFDGRPHPSLCASILNCISVQRNVWKCFPFQGVHGVDAPTDRASRNSKPKHVSKFTFKGMETFPSTYPTRDCYPTMPEEVHELNRKKLEQLKEKTSLAAHEVKLCYVHDPLMEAHHCQTESSHPERPARTRETIKLLTKTGVLPRMNKLPSREAHQDELQKVHSTDLLEMMSSLPHKTEAQLHSMEDQYTSIYFHPGTYTAALLAAGSLIQVVEKVVSGQASKGVGIIRPPGHHAEHDEPNGFCFFNNVAVAARHAVDQLNLKRVLILDWDIHHGNGIQHAFERDPRVLYISIHLYKNATFFPHSTDANYDKLGVDEGKGYNINIPWQKGGVGDAEYMAAFSSVVLPIAYHFNPELVLVSAGFDAAVNDPVGGCEVTPECYGHMTQLLSGLAGGRLVLALEGGYNLISTSHSLSMCCSSLLGDPLPPLNTPLLPATHAIATINAVLDAAALYWPPLAPFRVSLPAPDSYSQPKRRSGATAPLQADLCIPVLSDKAVDSTETELSKAISALKIDSSDREGAGVQEEVQ